MLICRDCCTWGSDFHGPNTTIRTSFIAKNHVYGKLYNQNCRQHHKMKQIVNQLVMHPVAVGQHWTQHDTTRTTYYQSLTLICIPFIKIIYQVFASPSYLASSFNFHYYICTSTKSRGDLMKNKARKEGRYGIRRIRIRIIAFYLNKIREHD